MLLLWTLFRELLLRCAGFLNGLLYLRQVVMEGPFELQYYYKGLYAYFTLGPTISDRDIKDFTNILQALVDRKKPFVFLVDTTQVSDFNPITCGYEIVRWMKSNKPLLRKYLLASSVIMKSKIVTDILNWVFDRQKPVSPNLITLSREDAENFIEERIPQELRTSGTKSG